MYTQSYPFRKWMIISVMLSASVISCKHDHEPNDSPALHISESEKLVIPAAIQIPENKPGGNTRVVTFYAVGVQKYKAQQKAGSSPATYEWVFVAPQADLFSQSNLKMGTHSAGPTWQLIGSTADSLYGQAFSPAKAAPSPDPASIDWLLLMPKTGKTPTGLFTDVAYIQRIATKGGKAPSILPTHADETADVNYTAVYRFTKKNP